MDELAKYNKERWEELAQANVEYSRPFLELDDHSARAVVDAQEIMGEVAGKEVLCLASGGGQQSAAFGLLGARVTVFDLAETQLERDRIAAAHYKLDITTVQGDMRDLSGFAEASFDMVWQAFSINFVPDVRPVFREVRRALRPGGLYRLEYFNPFTQAMDEDTWDGESYRLKQVYVDGAEMTDIFPDWDVEAGDGATRQIKSPREFRHALSTVLNGLIGQGFVLLGLWETGRGAPGAEPGTWQHFLGFTPPFLTIWASYRPDV